MRNINNLRNFLDLKAGDRVVCLDEYSGGSVLSRIGY